MTDAVQTQCKVKQFPLTSAKAALEASIQKTACDAVGLLRERLELQIERGGPLVASVDVRAQHVKAVVTQARTTFPGFVVTTSPLVTGAKVTVRDPRLPKDT